MSSQTIWGAIIFGYILVAIYPILVMENGPRPKNTVPGSMKLEQWKKRDKAQFKFLSYWTAGFFVLMATWYLAG